MNDLFEENYQNFLLPSKMEHEKALSETLSLHVETNDLFSIQLRNLRKLASNEIDPPQ